ncbi:MAG: hypothetical protein WD378_09720 [Egicoccus sp.]
MTRMTRSRQSGEEGIATLAFPLLLAVALTSVIVLVDIASYLVAAARAQQVADAAALAAVSVRIDDAWGDATAAAADVADAADARLESCHCGGDEASVEVSVDVPGLVVPQRAGASRVTATAEATLTDVEVGPRPDGAAAQPRRPFGR